MRPIQLLAAALMLGGTLGCGGSSPAAPAQAAAGEAYLREMIDVMKLNSVNRERIDWTSFTSQVTAKGAGAKTVLETYPAIELALKLLDDHHSYYVANSTVAVRNPTPPTGCTVATVPDPEVPADIGYVRIPQTSGDDPEGYGFAIHEAIRARDGAGVVGWIVDLRGNGGGNMWPMLAGVGPILGTGIVGYFVVPPGRHDEWGYGSGAATLNGVMLARVYAHYELLRANPRVAVLTDKRVASSGEAIAVAFRARPNTRSFGTDTCGIPTSIAGFAMSDGAFLALTVGVFADRKVTTYDSPLPPDERIDNPSAVVSRAIAWLRTGA